MSDSVDALIDLLMVDAMCNGEGTGITLPQLKMIRAEVDALRERVVELESSIEDAHALRRVAEKLADNAQAELAALRAERELLQGTCDQLMVDSMRRTEELDQLKLEVALVMKAKP